MDSRKFYAWERLIMTNYEVLFNQSAPADSPRVALDQMPEDLGWIAMVDRLSGGDITKHDLIYEKNYIECMNLLAYWHHKDRYVEQINKVRKRNIPR